MAAGEHTNYVLLTRRLFSLFLVTCVLGGALGCNRLARWLDLDPNAQSPVPNGPTQSVEVPKEQTHCCWCLLKANGQNSTQNYFGNDACEGRSNKPPYSTCRPIDVDGATCNLVRVVRRNGQLQCTPNPLTYHEGGATKTIATPDDYDLACRARVLVRAAQAQQGSLVEVPEAPPGTGNTLVDDQAYCSCETDSDIETNCRVVKISHGVPSVLATQARHEGQTSCTRAVCNMLFSQADYRSNCPRYVDGE